MMSKEQMCKHFKELEDIIGYSFNDKGLLKLAMTHSSYANEHNNSKLENNERLEFLGDAVLELTVSAFLYNEYKNMAICRSDTLPLVIFVFDANIKTILPLVCDLAPIVDKTMIGVQGNTLNCEFEDLDIDYNNKISVQYWSYYNSLALIESQLGIDSDECKLTMYLNPNE